MDKRGFSVKEAAAYLGMAVSTLRAEIAANRIPAKRRGANYLLDRVELDRYFDSLPER